jgi:hypothetical protein
MADTELLAWIRADLDRHLPEQSSLFVALEAQWRLAWGGERPYIPKRPAIIKAGRLNAALTSGTGPAQAFRDLGFAPSTGYRILARKW